MKLANQREEPIIRKDERPPKFFSCLCDRVQTKENIEAPREWDYIQSKERPTYNNNISSRVSSANESSMQEACGFIFGRMDESSAKMTTKKDFWRFSKDEANR